MTKSLKFTLSSTEPLWRWDYVPEGQQSLQHCHRFRLYGRVVRHRPHLSAKHMKAHLEFSKKHLKDSRTVRNKTFCFNKIKIKLFGFNSKVFLWRKPGITHHLPDTIPTAKHGGGSIMLWWCISAARTGRLVKVDGKLYGTKISLMKASSIVLKVKLPKQQWP